ncbi:MAG: hypothetical protein WC775_03855 [Patescibacteria group bacterium]|jgi:hypothetical protein
MIPDHEQILGPPLIVQKPGGQIEEVFDPRNRKAGSITLADARERSLAMAKSVGAHSVLPTHIASSPDGFRTAEQQHMIETMVKPLDLSLAHKTVLAAFIDALQRGAVPMIDPAETMVSNFNLQGSDPIHGLARAILRVRLSIGANQPQGTFKEDLSRLVSANPPLARRAAFVLIPLV